MTAPVFLYDGPAGGLDADRIHLGGAEGRHAAAVRRLQPGEDVVLTDGAGQWVEGVVVAVGRDGIDADVRVRRVVPPARPRLVAVQGLPKGERAELAVEMLTEVGVDEIVPWAAARCVTQWRGERGEKALTKWRAHARESAKQSRRPWLPEVVSLATTADVAARLRAATLGVVLHEEGTAAFATLEVPADGEVVFVVGPEGGIAPEELTEFAAAGATVCRLGATVLRTSTAGAAAAAVLAARSGRWG